MANISKKKALAAKVLLGLAVAGQGLMMGNPQAFAEELTVKWVTGEGGYDATKGIIDTGWLGGIVIGDNGTNGVYDCGKYDVVSILKGGNFKAVYNAGYELHDKTVILDMAEELNPADNVLYVFGDGAAADEIKASDKATNNKVIIRSVQGGWGGKSINAGKENTMEIEEFKVSTNAEQKYQRVSFVAGTIDVTKKITTGCDGEGLGTKLDLDTTIAASVENRNVINFLKESAGSNFANVSTGTMNIYAPINIDGVSGVNTLNFYANSGVVNNDNVMLTLNGIYENEYATGLEEFKGNINVYQDADFKFALNDTLNLIKTNPEQANAKLADFTADQIKVYTGVSKEKTLSYENISPTGNKQLSIKVTEVDDSEGGANPFEGKNHLAIAGPGQTYDEADIVLNTDTDWSLKGWTKESPAIMAKAKLDKGAIISYDAAEAFTGTTVTPRVGGGYVYGFDTNVSDKVLNIGTSGPQSYMEIGITTGTSTNGIINVYDVISHGIATTDGVVVKNDTDDFAKLKDEAVASKVIGSATDTIKIYNAGNSATLAGARNTEFTAGKIVIGAGESGNFNVGALTGVGENSSIEIKKDGISVGNFRTADTVRLENDGKISAATITINGTTTAKSVNAATKLDVNKELVADSITAKDMDISAKTTTDSITASGTVNINNIFTEKAIKAINAGTLNVNKASTLGTITAGNLTISETTTADTVSGLTALNFIVKDRTPMGSTDAEGTYMLTLTGGTTGNSGISSYTGDVQVLVSADASFAINDVVRLINIKTDNADDKLNIGAVKVYNGVSTVSSINESKLMSTDDIKTNNTGKTLSVQYKAPAGAVVSTGCDEGASTPVLDGDVIKNNGWLAKDTVLVSDKGSGAPADVAIVQQITVNQGGEAVTVFKSSGELTGKKVIVANSSNMGGDWKLFDSTNSHDNTAILTDAGAGWGGTVDAGDKNSLTITKLTQTKDDKGALHDGTVTYKAGSIIVNGAVQADSSTLKNKINLVAAKDVKIDLGEDKDGSVKLTDITAPTVAINSKTTANDIKAETKLDVNAATTAHQITAGTLNVGADVTATYVPTPVEGEREPDNTSAIQATDVNITANAKITGTITASNDFKVNSNVTATAGTVTAKNVILDGSITAESIIGTEKISVNNAAVNADAINGNTIDINAALVNKTIQSINGATVNINKAANVGTIASKTINIHDETTADFVATVENMNFYVTNKKFIENATNAAGTYMLTLASVDDDAIGTAPSMGNISAPPSEDDATPASVVTVNVYCAADGQITKGDTVRLVKVTGEGNVGKFVISKVYNGVSLESASALSADDLTTLKENENKTLSVQYKGDNPNPPTPPSGGEGDNPTPPEGIVIPSDPSNDGDVQVDETGKPVAGSTVINNYYTFISDTAIKNAVEVKDEVFTSEANHTDDLWKDGDTKVAVTVINSADDSAVGDKAIVGKSVKFSNPDKEYSGIITVAGSIKGKTGVGQVKNNIVNLVAGKFKAGTIISAGKLNPSLFGISLLAASDDNAGIINLTGGTYENDTAFNADTLNVMNKNLSAGHLLGVKTVNFYAPQNIANGETMLTLVDANPTTTKATVNAYLDAGSKLNDGDKVTLLNVSHDEANVDNFELGKSTWYKGVSQNLIVNMSKSEDNKSIVANIKETPEELRKQTKAIAETAMATISTVNTSIDLLTNVGYSNASQAVKNLKNSDASATNTFAPYAAIGYNNVRQNSGSYVNVKGYSVNVGLAKEISDNNGGKLLFGPFIEYGKSSYDSHLEDEFDTRGDGNSSAWGVGAMIRQDGDNGMYYEGSFRIGRAKSDFKSVNMIPGMYVPCEYESDSTYYGIHAGVGKTNKIGESAIIDTYAKLFYTDMQGDSVKLTTGETYTFDSVQSIRSKLGFRYTKATGKNNSFYAGLAWQHEFRGSSVAHYNGMDTPSPSVKGDTGVLELGVTLTGENSPLNIDLGLTGYAGKQRGCSVNAKFNWNF